MKHQLLTIAFLALWTSLTLAPAFGTSPGTPAAEGGAAPAGEKIKGWQLVQENPHTGIWRVFLSNAGMAAVNEKMGCTLVTKAPKWNVVMYNAKTKVYFLSPLNEWKGAQSSLKQSAKTRQAYSRATTSLIEKPPKKIKDEVILGHKTSLYLTDNLVTTGLKKVEFSITPDIEAPQQLQTVFGKIYGVGLTKLKGLPLKVSYIDENGKRSPVFETRKIDKKEIPLSEFDFPNNYKRVDSEIAVLMDEKGREAMASIMDDLGEGEGQDLDTLLDENPKTSTRKKTNSDSILDDVDTGTSTSTSTATSSSTTGTENEDVMALAIPALCIVVGCAIIGGAIYFFLLKKK